MAEFENPIRKRTSGNVPIQQPTEGADVSRAVDSLLSFGAQQAEQAQREQLSEDVEEEVRSFAEQPNNIRDLNILSKAEKDIQRGVSPIEGAPESKQFKRFQKEMTRLKKAFESGATSETELKARVNALTRQKIAEVPSLSESFQREAQQTLGLFDATISGTQSQLEAIQSDEQDEQNLQNDLYQQGIKQMQREIIDEYGILLNDPEKIIDFSRENIVGPRAMTQRLEQAQTQRDLSTLEQKRALPDVTQTITTRGASRINNVITQVQNGQIDEDQAILELSRVRADLATQFDQTLPDVSSEEKQRRLDRLDSMISKTEKYLTGETSLQAAQNRVKSALASQKEGMLDKSQRLRSFVAFSDLLGDELTPELIQQDLGGFDRLISEVVNMHKDMFTDPAQGGGSNIDEENKEIIRDTDAVSTIMQNMTSENSELSTADKRKAFSNVLRNMVPGKNRDISEVSIEEWNMTLDMFAKPEFKDALEEASLTPETKTEVASRINDYTTERLLPSLARKLENKRTLQTEAASGSEVPRIQRLLDITKPEIDKNGQISFRLDQESFDDVVPNNLSEDEREGVNQLRSRAESEINKLNRVWAKRWNQSVDLFSTLRDEDPQTVSKNFWLSQFGEEEIEESDEDEQ